MDNKSSSGKTSATAKRKLSGGSDACSVASSSKSQASAAASGDSGDKWETSLSLEKLLRGEPLGCRAWHARQSLMKLKNAEPKKNLTAEMVLLDAHISLFKRAEMIVPSKVKGISKAERERTCKDLELAGISIPPFTASGIVAAACDQAEEARDKLEVLTPGPCQPFDWRRPRLRDSGLSDLEKAKLLQRCVVDTLIPLVGAQEAGREKLPTQSPSLGWPLLQQSWSPMLKGALTEVCDIGRFLVAVLGATSDAGTMELVVRVSEARRGSQMLVRKARHLGGQIEGKSTCEKGNEDPKGRPPKATMLERQAFTSCTKLAELRDVKCYFGACRFACGVLGTLLFTCPKTQQGLPINH